MARILVRGASCVNRPSPRAPFLGSVPVMAGPFPLADLEAIGLAWARVSPAIALVPAFGLKALPVSARAVLTLGMAAAIYPAVSASAGAFASAGAGTLPFAARALEQIALGVPVAVAAAVPLWAATMAGGLVDGLRGAEGGAGAAVVEDRPGAFGVLLSMTASVVFLSTGGPARVATALATRPVGDSPALAAAHDLVAGIGLAIAVGGPLLAAAVVMELAFALVARAATPAQVHALFAPVRALGLLAVFAVLLERIGALLAVATRSAP